ncbi:hypothetical protein [Rhizobium sp. MHM7A]|uniref:hypothetical protein n=1 Tax=Rhizobium sp. MHM7A TaxID=2583233 RepID=UPI00110697C9|nr:hypothetical protein [Rhizobium sp. MHM7A]TLX16578.1 hypothetical protein FFR93_04360 [Rhizobium sp. MHM7A]
MSAAANDIIARLKAHGVTFDIEPLQFHSQAHGQCRSTFLVGNVRDRLTTMIDAKIDFKRYPEVILDTDTPPRKLVGKTLYVNEDNNLSGYGWCLTISDHDMTAVQSYRLFTMPPLKNTENHQKERS